MKNKKIVLIGDPDTGKSTITTIFGTGKLNKNLTSTIGSTYFFKKLNINDQEIGCELWDTAGSERYRSLITIYIRNAHLALLVFDLNNRESFKNVEKWYEILKLHQANNELMKILLIGNKDDLIQNVHNTEISEFTKKYNLNYYQLSCYNSNIYQKLNDIIILNLKDIIKNNEQITENIIVLEDKKHRICCY